MANIAVSGISACKQRRGLEMEVSSMRFLACFLIVFLFSFAADAKCHREELVAETWFAFLELNNPGIGQREMTGPEKIHLQKHFGCAPGNSVCSPDKIVVAENPEKILVLVVFIKEGCVTLAEEISRYDLRWILRKEVPLVVFKEEPRRLLLAPWLPAQPQHSRLVSHHRSVHLLTL